MLTMLPDIYHNNQANVNRYTSPMKPMGYASVQMGLNHHLVERKDTHGMKNQELLYIQYLYLHVDSLL